ncbi:hypothetical protein CC80DRAFT_503787 [Byssothecium circinans]|uniref:Uncharacterized protein n=1 Tax=Byssothecium circinans TaxID=147558 RepID=A0A6A5U8K3_9PLEO|nr:hypothetical protein CC80DRAFT_503787 [Byssothecium circinans]
MERWSWMAEVAVAGVVVVWEERKLGGQRCRCRDALLGRRCGYDGHTRKQQASPRQQKGQERTVKEDRVVIDDESSTRGVNGWKTEESGDGVRVLVVRSPAGQEARDLTWLQSPGAAMGCQRAQNHPLTAVWPAAMEGSLRAKEADCTARRRRRMGRHYANDQSEDLRVSDKGRFFDNDIAVQMPGGRSAPTSMGCVNANARIDDYTTARQSKAADVLSELADPPQLRTNEPADLAGKPLKLLASRTQRLAPAAPARGRGRGRKDPGTPSEPGIKCCSGAAACPRAFVPEQQASDTSASGVGCDAPASRKSTATRRT